MTHQYGVLEQTFYFGFVSNDTSGSAADGSSPLFDVRLGGAAAGAAPVLSGSATLLSHVDFGDGSHEVAVAATTANGFAVGNTYLVYATITADSQTPGACIGSFKLDPVPANVKEIDDTAQAATNLEILMDGNEGFYSAYAGPRGPGIYLNDAAANTNTVNGVDGTIGTPVSTIAAAKSLADSMSLDRIYLVNNSAITLAATMTDYEFMGLGTPAGNTIALGSQDVSNSHFYDVFISGVQGGTGRAQFEDCSIGVATLHFLMRRCALTDSASTGVTTSNNNDNVMDQCFSAVAGNTAPVVTASGANLDLSIRHYSGGLSFKSLNATGVVSVEGMGNLIFNGSNSTNAEVTVRGNISISDNTDAVNITELARWAPNEAIIASPTADSPLERLVTMDTAIGTDGTNLTEAGGTGDHLTALVVDVTKINGSATAAAKLSLGARTTITGTVDAGASNTACAITYTNVDTSPSADDTLIGRTIIFLDATSNAAEATDITDYVLSTRTVTYTALAGGTSPNSGSIVVIL